MKPQIYKPGRAIITQNEIRFEGEWKFFNEEITDEARANALIEWAADRLLETIDKISESNTDEGETN